MTTKRIPLLRLTLAAGLMLSAGACSTLSDLDPTGLLGGDDGSQTADQTGTPPPAQSDADAGTTPDLASIPARPAGRATPAQQQAATQSLAAAGAQAQYSADALRAGTEVSNVPPPPPPAPPAQVAAAAAAAAAPTADETPPSAEENAPPTAEPQQPAAAPSQATMVPPVESAAEAQTPPAATPSAALTAGTAATPATAAATAPTASMPPSAAPVAAPAQAQESPTAVAAAAPPPAAAQPSSGGEPAVPAAENGTAPAVAANAAQTEFKPSSAPPLSASVAQWVPAPVVAHYRRTASLAGASGVAVPAVPPAGAVVSDMAPGAESATSGTAAPSEIVYFANGSTALSAAARAKVRAAAGRFKAAGGTGTIRVVGHSSSRTANMPLEKHVEVVFQTSQARADAVAQELIRDGVPAARVLIEAVGDSQPVYYESMPKGEAGNRRAEIFVQG